MDPSSAELRGMTTVQTICTWAGMSEATQAAFYDYLGVRGDGPPRMLAAIAEEDVKEARTAMRVGGEALKPASRTMVVEAWRVARVATKQLKSQEEVAQERADQQKLELSKIEVLKAQAAAKQADMAVLKDSTQQDGVDTIKRSEVVDQISTLVAPMMSKALGVWTLFSCARLHHPCCV